jgi:hypothetical protein
MARSNDLLTKVVSYPITLRAPAASNGNSNGAYNSVTRKLFNFLIAFLMNSI